MDVFEELESEVRSYCRSWPVVFDRAAGSWLWDAGGHRYLDFFSGAGALNYGHNHPAIKAAVLGYLAEDRIVHSLDMYTRAKQEFLETLDAVILKPRGYDYRIQFPGPGGTNAVEAALKLVRKVTGRRDIVCFSGGFHGMSLGALAMTEHASARAAAGVPLPHAIRIPYDEPGDPPDLATFDLLCERSRRDARPAGVIVETVQGEGGLRPARAAWLRALSVRCREAGIPLIVDDVQMGCGRTGPFFSFELAGIVPDVVCLSKSLSGYGLPLALTLIRPDLDVWEPGEHNGTFRGVNPALVGATAALNAFWRTRELAQRTEANGLRIRRGLTGIAEETPEQDLAVRGLGMANGLVFESGQRAGEVTAAAFRRGLLVERSGPEDEVVKLLPALTSTPEEIDRGLEILAAAVRDGGPSAGRAWRAPHAVAPQRR